MAYILKLKNEAYEQTLNALTDPDHPGMDFSTALQNIADDYDNQTAFIIHHGNCLKNPTNGIYAQETIIEIDQIERVKVLDLNDWTELKEEEFDRIPENTEIIVECTKPTENWNCSPKWVFCATVTKWPKTELRIYNSNSIICQNLHSLYNNFERIAVKYFKDV